MKLAKLPPFEYRLFRELENQGIVRGEKIVVACSGGRDSVSLVYALSRVAPRLGFKIVLAHVNHGPNLYRNLAEARAKEIARELKLAISTAIYLPEIEMRSEDEFRRFRHAMLEKIRVHHGSRFVLVAHHADDLFETRMIRLVRGTGPQGLRAMSLQDGVILRPWLNESRAAIEEYAKMNSIRWVEDPTNLDCDPLRNWMRNEWLPTLEAKRPGSGRAMSRSFDALVASFKESELEIAESDGRFAFDRAEFEKLDTASKCDGLAKLLKTANVEAFGKSHLEEICKRLRTQQKQFTFPLLKKRFEVNAEQVILVCHGESL